jgi:hypothetical protein
MKTAILHNMLMRERVKLLIFQVYKKQKTTTTKKTTTKNNKKTLKINSGKYKF